MPFPVCWVNPAHGCNAIKRAPVQCSSSWRARVSYPPAHVLAADASVSEQSFQQPSFSQSGYLPSFQQPSFSQSGYLSVGGPGVGRGSHAPGTGTATDDGDDSGGGMGSSSTAGECMCSRGWGAQRMAVWVPIVPFRRLLAGLLDRVVPGMIGDVEVFLPACVSRLCLLPVSQPGAQTSPPEPHLPSVGDFSLLMTASVAES
jgi:hypothetical protein